MARTPVIFVPGLCGSFNLTVLLDWRGPTLSGWGFPPFIGYGKTFVEAFQRAGYTRDRDLFVAFYDWRKSVQDSASLYLKPWIDRARQRSGAAKVILVGHSMGGLVSRSYIQSRAYGGDVERLITMGTPHRGSPEAYYAWGAGEPKSDPNVKVVFDVYLWYLRHAHPFQTELSRLKAMRLLVPSVRDLLPVDNYLLNDGGPAAVPKQEDAHLQRNLVGDILNQGAALETLFGRVPVTTIAGVGFQTIERIVVAGPPVPPGEPPLFPDGRPVRDELDGDGDGTVMRESARLGHPRARNLEPLAGVSHGNLPDHPSALRALFGELGLTMPALGAAPAAPTTQLVVMTASPVIMTVQTPGGPPMQAPEVLGGAPQPTPPQRPRRVIGRDHGHSGKHLNIAVIPNPPAGRYQVRLIGTATGSFALGAFLISPEGVTVLGGAGGAPPAPEPAITAITTDYGRVAAGSELFFEVVCSAPTAPPELHMDRAATLGNAVARLRGAASGGVLGGAGGDPVDAVLGGAAEPEGAQIDALAALAERLMSADDPALAEALITQLQAAR